MAQPQSIKSMQFLVPGDISDIFFNLDHSNARLQDSSGRFNGFNDAILLEDAEWLLDALSRLGVATSCTPEALVANFHARI